MTNRVSAFLVILEDDTREDDAQAVADAILMIKGVLSVESHISDLNTQIAEARGRSELGKKLFEILWQSAPYKNP